MVVAEMRELENRRAPTTTLEGWRSFVNADPSDLALLPREQSSGSPHTPSGRLTQPPSRSVKRPIRTHRA